MVALPLLGYSFDLTVFWVSLTVGTVLIVTPVMLPDNK